MESKRSNKSYHRWKNAEDKNLQSAFTEISQVSPPHRGSKPFWEKVNKKLYLLTDGVCDVTAEACRRRMDKFRPVKTLSTPAPAPTPVMASATQPSTNIQQLIDGMTVMLRAVGNIHSAIASLDRRTNALCEAWGIKKD